MRIKESKCWVMLFTAVFLAILVITGMVTIIVDPYFHYHKPLQELEYLIYDHRYQNDGIVKHFDYDAIITGTSMSENFKTSEFDALFHTSSIKIPFAGASYKEINDNLQIATNYNSNIKIIMRCLDYNRILQPADTMRYEEEAYPRYLYDDFFYNDVKYIFNKSVLFKSTFGVFEYMADGGHTTSFDEYSNWSNRYAYGKEAVDETYVRPEKASEITHITAEDYKNITENITQNVITLANEHPEIEFFIFFSPYSIYFWDNLNQAGTIGRQIDAEQYAIELILQCDNIHLFSFFTEYEMICDLNNYKDMLHYNGDINSQILIWLKEGTHELTKYNYQKYCDELREFYMNYDYESLFIGDK